MQLHLDNINGQRLATREEAEAAALTGEPIAVKCVKIITDKDDGEKVLGITVRGQDGLYEFIDLNEVAFIPEGRSIKPIYAQECLGKQIWVCAYNEPGGELKFSRRKAQKKGYQYITEQLKPGMVLDCIVKGTTSIGIFADVGFGFSGFLPSANIGLSGRLNKQYDFAPGQRIKAAYAGYTNKGIKLSMRELFGTFEQIVSTLEIGEHRDGIVTEVKENRVMVEITPNLVSVVRTPTAQGMKVGQHCRVVVNSVNFEKKQVGCSIVTEPPMLEGKNGYEMPPEHYKPVVGRIEGEFSAWTMR